MCILSLFSIWFVFQDVQILKALVLGEEERGQSQYQVMCFLCHFQKGEFISSDAMSKLRQVRWSKETIARVFICSCSGWEIRLDVSEMGLSFAEVVNLGCEIRGRFWAVWLHILLAYLIICNISNKASNIKLRGFSLIKILNEIPPGVCLLLTSYKIKVKILKLLPTWYLQSFRFRTLELERNRSAEPFLKSHCSDG